MRAEGFISTSEIRIYQNKKNITVTEASLDSIQLKLITKIINITRDILPFDMKSENYGETLSVALVTSDGCFYQL